MGSKEKLALVEVVPIERDNRVGPNLHPLASTSSYTHGGGRP